MLPEQIYQPQSAVVPEITVEVLQHTDLGDRVICAHCTVCGLSKKYFQLFFQKDLHS